MGHRGLDAFRPFRDSLTLSFSPRERESFGGPIHPYPPHKTLKKPTIRANNYRCGLTQDASPPPGRYAEAIFSLDNSKLKPLIAWFRSREAAWCLVLFVLALIPRLFWAFARHPQPFSDMEDYYLCAVNFLKGSYLAQSEDRLAYRAPLYPLFLVFCLKAFPDAPLLAIRILQSLLGALSAVVLFFVSRGLLASWQEHHPLAVIRNPHFVPFLISLAFAWLNNQVFFCSVLMSETLFVLIFLIWIWTGLSPASGWSIPRLFGFSFLIGILALLRPIALFFLPMVVYQTFRHLLRDLWLKKSWLPLTAWLFPIFPWTLRNILVLHYFVLITTNSGVNLFTGHNPAFGYYEGGLKEVIRRQFIQEHGPNEVLEDRHLLRLGLWYALQDPWAAVERAGWKFFFLYLADVPPWPWDEYHHGTGLRLTGDIPWPLIPWRPWFFYGALVGYLYATLRRIPVGSILTALGLYTFACMVFFANTRFRLPLEPLLLIGLALGFLALVDLCVWGYGKTLKNLSMGLDR